VGSAEVKKLVRNLLTGEMEEVLQCEDGSAFMNDLMARMQLQDFDSPECSDLVASFFEE
jgi:hypothetical protein